MDGFLWLMAAVLAFVVVVGLAERIANQRWRAGNRAVVDESITLQREAIQLQRESVERQTRMNALLEEQVALLREIAGRDATRPRG